MILIMLIVLFVPSGRRSRESNYRIFHGDKLKCSCKWEKTTPNEFHIDKNQSIQDQHTHTFVPLTLSHTHALLITMTKRFFFFCFSTNEQTKKKHTRFHTHTHSYSRTAHLFHTHFNILVYNAFNDLDLCLELITKHSNIKPSIKAQSTHLPYQPFHQRSSE